MSKKIDKELKKEQQISDGVATLQESRDSIEELAKSYDIWIDEAAELGENEYSDQLIADQVELEEFSRNLKFFEIRIREGAVSARAFNKLKSLPTVLENCKSLLKNGLDLHKIGKQMGDFKKSLDGARKSIKDLRSELSTDKDPIYTDLFGKKTKEDPKIAAKIAAKKDAREARLAAKIASSTVSPVEANSSVNANESDIDVITAMIDEEKRKK